MDKNNYIIPGSIVLAGIIIAAAVIYALNPQTSGPATPQAQNNTQVAGDIQLRAVTQADHYRGNLEAPVKIVEYSDLECPFCKRFHTTMQQVMSEYGTRNQVVWIYRHYPIEQLHSKAIKEAEASECAAELGGNDKFWAYVDEIFRVTPANNGLDLALLPQIAEQIGLNRTQFEQCLASGRHAKKVSADLEDALKSGGRGTPHSIVIAPNGKKFTIPGAQPYTNVKQLIDQALQER